MVRRRSRTLIAVALACASCSVLASELTPQEITELRARADGLIAERQRNPGWDGGTTRLNQSPGDVNLSQSRGEVKTPQQGEVKPKVKSRTKPKSESATKRMRRAVENAPGALVR